MKKQVQKEFDGKLNTIVGRIIEICKLEKEVCLKLENVDSKLFGNAYLNLENEHSKGMCCRMKNCSMQNLCVHIK